MVATSLIDKIGLRWLFILVEEIYELFVLVSSQLRHRRGFGILTSNARNIINGSSSVRVRYLSSRPISLVLGALLDFILITASW